MNTPPDKSSQEADRSQVKNDSSNKENFNEFFEEFKSDSLFQISRIDFPLKHQVPDFQGDGYINEPISKIDWEFHEFYYDSAFLTRQYDKYTQELVDYGDSAKILIHGIGNGIYVDFIFILLNNKWILIRMDDFSI